MRPKIFPVHSTASKILDFVLKVFLKDVSFPPICLSLYIEILSGK